MTAEETQSQLDEVYREAKEWPVDSILHLLDDALTDDRVSRHTVYVWAEEISAGIPPKRDETYKEVK